MIDPAAHLGLAAKYAMSYSTATGEPFDECYSLACLGLCRAARYFKPELGYAFSTYAVACIKTDLARGFPDWRRRRVSGIRTPLSLNAESRSGGGAGSTRMQSLAAPEPDEPMHAADLLDEVLELAEAWDRGGRPGSILVRALSRGWTLRRLGRELCLTPERARQIVNEFRAALGATHPPVLRAETKARPRVTNAFIRAMKAA